MFKVIKNKIILDFNLFTKSPLAIKGINNVLDPTLPDSQCVKSYYKGELVPIIPGSTLKGVFRTHYELLTSFYGGECCDVFDNNCSKKLVENEKENGKDVYKRMCPACKLFGSSSIASRISFLEAYPINKLIIGEKVGVGINRITGGAQRGALYNIEIVESGIFNTKIILENYELYQLKLIILILREINDGYIGLGSSTTSGSGYLEVKDLKIIVQDYRDNINNLTGYNEEKSIELDYIDKDFYRETCLYNESIDSILDSLKEIVIEEEIKKG